MKGVLKFFGIIFIVAGIIGTIITAKRIDLESYNTGGNGWIQEFENRSNNNALMVGWSCLIAFSGIGGGLVLLSMESAISLLEDIKKTKYNDTNPTSDVKVA
jgi:hypothetical protein